MAKYSINDTSLAAIADKIREKNWKEDPMTPAEMVAAIDKMGPPMDIDERPDYYRAEPWVRPAEYPNLELIDLTDFDGVYMTFDMRKTPGYGWVGLYGERALNYSIYIERGHLDQDNVFVVDEQHTIANKGFFRQALDEANGEVQLWRMWSKGHLTRVAFATNSGTSAQNFINQLCPCVERRGRLPYMTSCTTSVDTRYNYVTFGTMWLCRDDIMDVVSVTNMSNAYENCYELREVHFDGWDTSKVTTMTKCFIQCHKLRSVPTENLVTPKVTSLSYMFQYCYSLESVDISHFDIDKVTTMAYMFEVCRSLKYIKLPESGGTGALTTISSMFSHCSSLERLPENYERLNVTNVNNFSYTFANCRNLKVLDVHMWNVMKPTTLVQMCINCVELLYADFSGWDVSKVTAANSAFEGCFRLQTINLDGWSLDVITNMGSFHKACRCLKSSDILARINWGTVTRLDYAFSECYALETVEIDGCDTDNVLTTVASMFANCWSLRQIHMPGMHYTAAVSMDTMFNACHSLVDLDVSNWHIDMLRSVSALVSGCYLLKEIDLSDWTIDDGNLTAKNSVNSMFSDLRSCKVIKGPDGVVVTNGSMNYMWDNCVAEYIDVSGIDLSKATNIYVPNTNCSPLRDYYPPLLPGLSMNFSSNTMLTRESLVRIFNALPTVTTAKTITIGQSNRLKLTDADKAIATGKGWTIA